MRIIVIITYISNLSSVDNLLIYRLYLSDDMSIKLWNWDKNWTNQQVFEGHTHYVMQIVINPKDNNTFASASLDRTVKVQTMVNSYQLLRAYLQTCYLSSGLAVRITYCKLHFRRA